MDHEGDGNKNNKQTNRERDARIKLMFLLIYTIVVCCYCCRYRRGQLSFETRS